MNSYPCRLTLLTAAAAALAALVALAAAASPAHAAGVADAPDLAAGATPGHDWPQWRGPHFDGSGEATDLPDKFDKSTNVLWTAKLPGSANSTPVVAGGRIFVGALDHSSKKLTALCLDLKDGHALWQQDMGLGVKQKNNNDMSSPSAVTDGRTVFFYFGTGDLAAFEVDGKPLWSRNIQKDFGDFHFMWLYGSSPLLYKDKLYIQCLHNTKSYDHPDEPGEAGSFLLAIDPGTGKDLWKQSRPNEAVGESKEAYTTPIPAETDHGTQIIVAGGDCVTGHDPDTGKELWRFRWNPSHANFQRLVTSPVCGEGLVFACAPKRGEVMAVKEGGSGDVTGGGAAWQTRDFTSDVCVPLMYQHQLYVLNGDAKTLHRVDPRTGTQKWEGKLGGNSVFRASPTAADGKIYCINESGDLWVLAAGEEFKVLNQISLGGRPVRSSVVPVDGHVLVRVGEELFAFGKK